MLTGYKTLIASAMLAILPAATAWLTTVDPTKIIGISPTMGMVLGGVFAILRFFTNTPILTGK